MPPRPSMHFLKAANAAVRLLALCLWLLAPLGAAAAPAPPAAPADEAPVLMFGRPIAVFRAPFLGVAPADRARRTEAAIRDLLAGGGPGVVTVQQVPQGSVLLIDGSLALILTPQDVDVVRGQTLESATRAAATALSRGIAETREARDRGRLLEAGAWALGATLLYAVAVWLLWRLRNALSVRAASLLDRAAGRAGVTASTFWEESRAHAFSHWLVRVLSWLLLALFTYQWLVFLLRQFPATRASGERLGGFLVGLFERIGGGIVHALPDLAVAVVIFLLARGLVAALRPVFDRLEQEREHPGPLAGELARPTRRLVSLAIWLFAIVMAYPYLPGADSEAFKGMSVLLGVMITLGGSSIIAQAASGLILMYSRTLRVGDQVRINELEGTVVELGSFTTRIRTGAGHELTLPNAVVIGSATLNYSRGVAGALILDTTLDIGYDTPWRQVEALLLEATRRTADVLSQPSPQVLQRALTDFYVEYRLVCLAAPRQAESRALLLHRLHANILDVFNEHGVQIMAPHYEGDPAGAKLVAPGHPFAPRTAGPRAVAGGAGRQPA